MELKNLSDLPSDTMRVILSCLNGYHIARLYETGDKRLIYDLTTRGDVKHFKVHWHRASHLVWPSIIHFFPHLESVSLVAPKKCAHLAVKGTRVLELPKSLKSLELGFLNGTAALCGIKSSFSGPKLDLVNLNNIFPGLTYLKTTQPPLKHRLNLSLAFYPSTLTKCDLTESIAARDIAKLPRGLQELKCIVTEEDGPFSIDLPPTLILLVLHRATCAKAFQFIPSTVTYLTISFGYFNSSWYNSDKTNCFGLGWLRCTDLQHLEVTSLVRVEGLSDDAFLLVPPTVKSLAIELDHLLWGSPRFVHRLSLLTRPERFEKLSICSPGLDHRIAPPKGSEKCFQRFSGLRFFRPPPGSPVRPYSNHLESISTKHVTRAQSNQLPRSLTYLSATSISDARDNEPSLTDDESPSYPTDEDDDTCVDEEEDATKAHTRAIKPKPPVVWNFPSNLSQLLVWSLISGDALEQALTNAPNLSYLRCSVVDGKALALMPPSLKVIMFNLHYENTLVPLPLMPNLEEFDLKMGRGEPIEKEIIASFLDRLSGNVPNLRTLYVDGTGIQGSVLPVFIAKSFPSIQSLSIRVKSLENDDVAHLPHSLTELLIEKDSTPNAFLLSGDDIFRLPPGLVTLRLPYVVTPPDAQTLVDHFPFLLSFLIEESNRSYGDMPQYSNLLVARHRNTICQYYPEPSGSK